MLSPNGSKNGSGNKNSCSCPHGCNCDKKSTSHNMELQHFPAAYLLFFFSFCLLFRSSNKKKKSFEFCTERNHLNNQKIQIVNKQKWRVTEKMLSFLSSKAARPTDHNTKKVKTPRITKQLQHSCRKMKYQ